VLFGARPSLGQAQWLLDRARDSGDKAWRCVGCLGNSRTWSTESLWASSQTGPTASGLLSDPNFKLLNLLNRSPSSDGEGLDFEKLWHEVICYEEFWHDDMANIVGLGAAEESSLITETFSETSDAASKDAGGDA
jgi:hypothetical protein